MTQSAPTCTNCGAPDGGDLVTCRFCRQAVSAEAARTAIPCPNPQCRVPNRWGKQKCIQCQAWLVVSCVFCGAISPHNLASCMQCNEAFAGAAERKQQQVAQQHYQQGMQQANVFGGIAASFIGAAVGSALSGSWDYDNSSSDTFDISDAVDDSGFDFDD
jgi:hypothetical protein